MSERARQAVEHAQPFLPWVGLAGMTAVAAFGNVGPQLMRLLLEWGVGLLIFLAFMQYAPALLRAQQHQAVATEKLAASHMAVATEMGQLRQRDDLKFEQILLGQQLILDRLNAMEDQRGQS